MIDLLNTYFVPVYVSNEDFEKGGSASADEKKERMRIYLEAGKAKLSTGTVHVCIVAPDGHPIDSQHVATATQVDKLTAMLERTVDRLKTPAGKALVAPCNQMRRPKTAAGDLLFHLIARNVQRQGKEDVPTRAKLGETRSGNWGAYPGENWIVLQRKEWSKFLPAKEAAVGGTWELDPETAARFLTYFYPSTENNDIKTHRIDKQSLRATVLSIEKGVVRVRLDGSLKMKHPFYHKDDGNFVEANLVGILEYETKDRRIRLLNLVTDGATYGRMRFGVTMQTVTGGTGRQPD
ncbi:MAG TPA: hypothetical protein VKE98_08485 [Gemmataceae bacterium]|nr:hypothetical protein [Gemmataceae bacterium]